MKKFPLIIAFLLMNVYASVGQERWYTKEAKVSFFCDGSAENIEAYNNKGFMVIDVPTGKIEISVLMKAFTFEKALMQEHFNENYVESDKFPKAIFKGTIKDPENIKWTTDGEYAVEVSGDLTIHGVTNVITTPAKITIKNGVPVGDATFIIALADYNIDIPKIVEDKVSKNVRLVVQTSLNPFVKQP
ncbi:MAG TPA: YceI family protein [Bacteroidia bacterium]|nr:YceI family protein [Bacteroidia bacterium]